MSHNDRPTRAGTITAAQWLGIAVLAIVVLIPIGWGLGWLSVPFQTTSAQNVREQWKFAYQFDEDLQAQARNACIAEKAYNEAPAGDVKTQRQTQLIANEQNYNRIAADYDARLRNAFEAKLVRPSDVPDKAPTLAEMKRRVC